MKNWFTDRAASLLRITILLMLGGMCYQLGYNSGYDNGNSVKVHRQIWEAAGETVPDLESQTSLVDYDEEQGAPQKGIVLAPPVVLNGPPRDVHTVAARVAAVASPGGKS
jgi:hypothetical protein